MRRQACLPAPTPGPWQVDDDSVVYCHWRYTGWPHFGRITIARLDSCWPIGPERRANLALITSAVNACFTVSPKSPIVAAMAFPMLVSAAKDYLAHGNDPNMPLLELHTRLRDALKAATGGAL